MVLNLDIPKQFRLRVLSSIKSMLVSPTGEVHYIGGTEVLPPPLSAEEEAEIILK